LVNITKSLYKIGIFHCNIRRRNILLTENISLIDFENVKKKSFINDIKTAKLWDPKWEGEVDLKKKYNYYSLCVTIGELLTRKYLDENILELISEFRIKYEFR